MPRIVLIAAVFVAAVLADPRPVRAAEGPWCALIGMGEDAVYEDCRYRTLEECRPNVLAGNRGFCNPNPRWTQEPAPGPRRHGKRHVRQQ
jgi:hypothetical protein